jgi:hypothetical protein
MVDAISSILDVVSSLSARRGQLQQHHAKSAELLFHAEAEAAEKLLSRT